MKTLKCVLAVAALGFSALVPPSVEAWEFHCTYGASPLTFGSNPTLYSFQVITPIESLTYRTAGIASTASSPSPPASFGSTYYWDIPVTMNPLGAAFTPQLVLAYVPFTSIYNLQSYGQMWFITSAGNAVTYPTTGPDFCTAQGLVSASS